MPDQNSILITGCSSGFGLLMATHFAEQGHQVIATMRNLDKRADLDQALKAKNVSADIRQLDVTDQQTITDCVEYVIKTYGRIDVLINNAGYSVGGFFEDLSEQDIRQLMETNFFGVQNMTRAVLPIMRKQGGGKIITISSVAGLVTYPCLGAYNVSKWAVEAFMESLSYEVSPFNIKIAMVEPGAYRTKIFDQNARYAEHFYDPQSPYYAFSQAMKRLTYESIAKNRRDPMQIVYCVDRIIRSQNPALRNIPGLSNKLIYVLRRYMPQSLFLAIVRTVFKQKIQKYT